MFFMGIDIASVSTNLLLVLRTLFSFHLASYMFFQSISYLQLSHYFDQLLWDVFFFK